MRKIKEVLRLKFEAKLSHEKTAGRSTDGVAVMRVRHHSPHRITRLARRLFAVILICSIAVPSPAAAIGAMMPQLGGSAAALTLTLAARGRQAAQLTGAGSVWF